MNMQEERSGRFCTLCTNTATPATALFPPSRAWLNATLKPSTLGIFRDDYKIVTGNGSPKAVNENITTFQGRSAREKKTGGTRAGAARKVRGSAVLVRIGVYLRASRNAVVAPK